MQFQVYQSAIFWRNNIQKETINRPKETTHADQNETA